MWARRLEPERRRVADVQVAHACARGLDPLGLDDDVANRVGEVADAARQPAMDGARTTFDGVTPAILRPLTKQAA